MKKGLVLEGGGIRGIFSAGVMDVLMEEGIVFDGAIGVSAGAAFGCNYKSKQPRRAVRYNLKYAKDPRYSSVRSLLKTGDLFNAQFCYHDIPEKLYPFDWKTFRENPMKFYLVCTDVETGKPVYHLCDNDSEWQMLEWFRASGSMPLVSRVVEIGDQKLLDGGITDSIPLRFMESKGYERNVVILTRPADYVKEPASLMRVMNRVLHQYPETLKAIENRHNVYNETVAYIRQREAGKYAFVIRPEADLDVGRVEHDRFKIREAYKAGRKAARKRLNALRRFLEAADNEVFADGTYSTNASIIANAPGMEKSVSDDFLDEEEKVLAEAAPAQEAAAAEKGTSEKARSYVGTIEEAIPAPAEEKNEKEEDPSSFRAQVFGDAIDEQVGFEKPVSFVDRQEAALRRERESAMEAEEAEEKAEAERIAAEKAEAERIAAEKAEAERIAAEKAEAERIAAEKAEAERIAAEKAEAERIAAEKAEAERIAAEKAEAERIAAEKAEAERIAAEKAEAERIAAEKAEAERIAAEKAEAERIAAEKAEAERIAAEKAEAERIAAEKAEAERIAAEKAEAERIAAEKAEAERIAAEKAEAERIAAEKAEAERIAAEKAEAERIAAEKAEAERIAAEKAEAERIAAEKAEAERKAAERAEAERIAAEKREAARKAREEKIAAGKAEAEKAAAEKAAAVKAAMQRAAAARAAAITRTDASDAEDAEAGPSLKYRGRWQKSSWKPAGMNSLKKEESEE